MPGCSDQKYFHVGNSCIKRTLRRHEWSSSSASPPSTFPQRWKNDAAILQYLAARTNIPLSPLYEDDSAFYHCTESVDGVIMDSLSEEEKTVVTKELPQHVANPQVSVVLHPGDTQHG